MDELGTSGGRPKAILARGTSQGPAEKGPTSLGLFDDPYMVNSTYRLSLGGDLPFRAAWFSNPAGFGNQLVVDGRTIAHGNRRFFDEA
jgi:hypothetical protein